MRTLHFTQLPSMPAAYLRALLPKRRRGDALPELRAAIEGLVCSAQQLEAYRATCHLLTPRDDTLPLTYPHVLAAPLHVQMLVDAAMPFPALGLVHVRNTIRQTRPISRLDALDIETRFGQLAEHERGGHTFELVTAVRAGGEEVWREVSTILARPANARPAARAPQSHRPGLEPGVTSSQTWPIRAETGRAYAAVSGDYNPIHLSAPSAKVFGFRRAIAHGMWTLPRCLGALHDELPEAPCEVDVTFKRPVLLPSRVALSAWRDDARCLRFELRSPDQRIVHLRGELRASSTGDA